MIDPPRRASQRIREARAHTRPHGLSAMVLAFSVLFVLAYVFIVRTPPQPPVPDVRSAVGTYTWQSAAGGTPGPGGGTFAAWAGGDASGSFRAAGEASTLVSSSYDAGARTETSSGKDAASAVVTVGAWPPVWRLSTPSPLEFQGLAAIVRAAAEDGDTGVGVKPLEQDGRAVWRAAVTLDGTAQEFVVDQASGLVTWWTDGSSTFTADVAWGTSGDAPSAGSTAAATPAAGVSADRTYTYRRSLATAAAAAGFDPLVSALPPDGYAQAAVATTRAGEAPVSWVPDDGSAGPLQIVQLFTRGLAWYEVRQLGAAPAGSYERALATARATGASFEQSPLEYGFFAGATAATWYTSAGPALLIGDGRRVVFVTGALTRQELLSLAEGLRPLSAGASASPASSPEP